MARAETFRLDLSGAILEELVTVLRDYFHWDGYRLHFARLKIAAIANLVTPTRTLKIVKEDPDDNRILECAEAAGSDVIVTRDKDLLRLSEYQGTKIGTAGDFLPPYPLADLPAHQCPRSGDNGYQCAFSTDTFAPIGNWRRPRWCWRPSTRSSLCSTRWIFRHIIDNYATRYSQYTSAQFLSGVSGLLAAAVGVAFVSRVAKNFQDYCVNLITQQVGARIYADGIRHSLELPYTLFEDQRSGETLGKLQKVRTDVEKLITMAVNLVFTTLIGLVFVIVYASRVHWTVVPAYLLTVPLLGGLSSVLSRKIKEVQKHIVRETTALAGATTEIACATSNW